MDLKEIKHKSNKSVEIIFLIEMFESLNLYFLERANENLYKQNLLHKNAQKNSANFAEFFVGLLGFEPRQTESKSVVLPLHHNPIFKRLFRFGVQK